MQYRNAAPTICIVLCLAAKAAGLTSFPLRTSGRDLLQSQTGATLDVQIPVAAELQVTCPFFVPFNQASQALITGALQAVLPPNSTFTAVTMTQQLNSDTVIVDAQFQLRESQLAVLVANKCCDLEVLFLQQAVLRIDPSAVAQHISMSLIDWRIGNTSMGRAPAGAPSSAPPALAATPAPAPAAAVVPMAGPALAPGTPGPPLPSGQAPTLDTSTPFFLGGVTAESTAAQADANITVVDVPVRAICLAASNITFGATLDLAIAHRKAVKTLLWPMGFEVEVLNMSDSSNSTSLVSVDFLNRLWVHNEGATGRAFRLAMLRLAAAAPRQYVRLMHQSGFDVQVVVLNTSVAGRMVNSSLPSVKVVPPTNAQNVRWSAILMTLEIEAPSLLPFTDGKQRMLTGIVIQVLQQYGAAFVHIQSYNETQSPAASRKLQRKLLSGATDDPGMGARQGRGLAQTGATPGRGMLQVDMIVTVPAEQQLQVLSLGTTDETSQSLAASGFPGTVTLAAASPDAIGGPFSANYPAARAPPAVAEGVAPSPGGGLSKGRKDAAIAVPVILGALIAAVLAGLLLLRRRRRSGTKGRAVSKEAPVGKGSSDGQTGGPIMDTARIQSTGGTDIPLSAGDMYDTDMDDKMGLTRSPAKQPPLQDDGLDIQATQAGAVRRVLGRMHAREQEVSNALAETATFVMHHLQAGSVFRDRYSLTGWRWRSPNAIWCGADQVDEPWGPVALKMYALTSDFIREKELLDMPYSSEHWPTVLDTYTYSDVGFEGDACPPCIVMQPPVATLQTWMDAQNRANLVWEEQVATLYNLCKALQSFHARGMVHCSLAPPSFSWFQGGQGWKVAACGDWAQAGMHVRSCYQLRYASPEAVQGDLFDVAGAAADPAMDMWALGAIAFEIFTAQGLFSRKSYTDNDVINMLLGFDRLPSESQPAFWRQIRDTAAQRLVQNLLRRVPEQRSTINEVLASPIFNTFTQTSKASNRGNRSLWSQDFVDKLTTTASSLRSMDTRMSDELQPRQASALLDAKDRNGANTASDESLTSKELQEIGSFNSAGSVDKKNLYRVRTQNN